MQERRRKHIRMVTVRHGRINPSNKSLLDIGDPHADRDWLTEHLTARAGILCRLSFAAVFSGEQKRMTEMADGLLERGAFGGYTLEPRLNASVTYHENVLYPIGVEEPMKGHMPVMLQFCHELYETYGDDALVLCITSGARMAPLLALSLGYEPPDEKTMMAWAVEEEHNPPLGAIWVFEYDPESRSLTKIDIEQILL